MIKAIIFDFGGVMEPDYDPKMYTALAKHLNVSLSAFRAANTSVYHQFEKGKLNEYGYWGRLLKKLKIKEDPKRFTGLWAKAYGHPKGWASSYSLVRKLKRNYQVALLSNVTLPIASLNSRRYALFNPVILSCKAHFRKPDLSIFSYCLRKIGCLARESIFIDNLAINVRGARKAGIDSIQFRSIFQLKKELKKRHISV